MGDPMLQLLAQSSSELMYDTSYGTTSDAEAGAMLGALGVFFIPLMVYLVIAIIAMWKMFVKAGKPGWAAIVPIYNIVVMLQIATMPMWWLAVILLSFIPVVGMIASLAFSIVVGINIGRKFGKSDVWGAILNGILGIGYLILGFGSATYNAAAPAITGTNTSTGSTPGGMPTSGSPTAPTAPTEPTAPTPPTPPTAPTV